MSDDQAREMRPETTSEHIARDMREGRFPEQSERQMVPVLASLPHEIQVWRSMDTLDHIGTWSTTRYPPEAVTYVPKSDADAAVALAHKNMAARIGVFEASARDRGDVPREAAFCLCVDEIRALAPADGLAMVQELRAEARENAMQALASMGQAQEAYEAQLEAEAELAAAKQREAALTKALEACVASLERVDTAEGVCCCGDSMDRHSDPMSCGHSPVDMGDYYAGQALESARALLDARAALAPTLTDPGDGWTWNERLGWIGPDGKPAARGGA